VNQVAGQKMRKAMVDSRLRGNDKVREKGWWVTLWFDRLTMNANPPYGA
jgi:hypothetical protein